MECRPTAQTNEQTNTDGWDSSLYRKLSLLSSLPPSLFSPQTNNLVSFFSYKKIFLVIFD